MDCCWIGQGNSFTGCKGHATEIIVYGCLNGHIGETPFCDHHAGMWIKAEKENKLQCYWCNQLIDYWNAAEVYRATIPYKPQFLSSWKIIK
jgi:hypothetical protein